MKQKSDEVIQPESVTAQMTDEEIAEERIKKWIKKNNPRSILDLTRLNIKTLPELPDTVEYLNIYRSKIEYIDKLPPNLKWLDCARTKLKTLPPLPTSLHYLNGVVEGDICLLKVIPKHITKAFLNIDEEVINEGEHESVVKKRIEDWIKAKKPTKLLDLSCMKLETLPPLPDTVEWLNCGGNPLKELSNLPKNLKRLECRGLLAPTIDLPYGVEYVDCKGSLIKNIDNFPDTVRKIKAGHFTDIEEINRLPL